MISQKLAKLLLCFLAQKPERKKKIMPWKLELFPTGLFQTFSGFIPCFQLPEHSASIAMFPARPGAAYVGGSSCYQPCDTVLAGAQEA